MLFTLLKKYEKFMIQALMVMMAIVMGLATLDLGWLIIKGIIHPPYSPIAPILCRNLTIIRVMTNLAGACHEPKNPHPTFGSPRQGVMAETLLPT